MIITDVFAYVGGSGPEKALSCHPEQRTSAVVHKPEHLSSLQKATDVLVYVSS